MAGLNLISTYSSDSEDDAENKREKSLGRLPLPQSIKLWTGVAHHQEVIDDPAEHDGRTRTFKHERGNWATLIYINYAASADIRDWMSSGVSSVPFEGNTFSEQFHVSLTRTSILKFHWIESFVESLKKLCRGVDRFALELKDVEVYCNEERTRTFLGIRCQDSDKALESVTRDLNNLLDEYQLPPFYEDPSYHISFFWCLGDREADLKRVVSQLARSFNAFLAERTEEAYLSVEELHCKIGNKLYVFPLR